MNNFVHLHLHTEYSLLDGACRIKDLVKKAKSYGMPAIAITDHGTMHGIADFYKACKDEGIKPIIGCEVYVARGSRFDKNNRRKNDDGDAYGGPAHLVLLATNQIGYQNLIKIVSLAYTEGFYYKPRVDHELLQEYSEGLICLSACLGGEIPRLIMTNNYEEAKKVALQYQNIFGRDNYYLEIQDHKIPVQKSVNEALFKLSEETGIPLVATNDSHYIEKDDAKFHDLLLCIQTKRSIFEPSRDEASGGRMKFPSEEFWFKSYDDMAKLFPHHLEALDNTAKIAERCNVEIEFGNYRLPQFECPPGHDEQSYLRQLVYEGLKDKYGEITTAVTERTEFEFSVIEEKGFSGYFLIVWDFIKWARENGIRVGPGRGSVAGSIIAYALDIMQIDPLKYGTLFERFLNIDRMDPPDIDVDFLDTRRDEVIQYVQSKYGEEKVAQIATFGTFGAKGAVRDVARYLLPKEDKFNLRLGDKISSAIPDDIGISLADALQQSSELKSMYNTDEQVKEVYDLAMKIEGLPRHSSVHAAAVVIAPSDITDYVPVLVKNGVVSTQLPKNPVESLGLLKMDFLGLKTLTIVSDALENIKIDKGEEVVIEEVPLDDPQTYELLCAGDTSGVFQLESEGMRNILKQLKPSRIEDIIAIVALYRPGPMDAIPDYIANAHGEKIDYLLPGLEKHLGETYGVIVYQEQVMKIVQDVAGFSPVEANYLRKALSKKKMDMVMSYRKQFIDGGETKGYDQDVLSILWDKMAKFGEYGFNKSHSSVYGLLAYHTAYLKANYPLHFMAAEITSVMSDTTKVAFYLKEAESMGIEVLPPNVNLSYKGFRVYQDKILFGLQAIKNVGSSAIDSIVTARRDGPFTSLYDFCQRVDLSKVNRRVIEALIYSGAMGSLGAKRSQLMAIIDNCLENAVQEQKNKQNGQVSLFDVFSTNEVQFEIPLPDIPEFVQSKLLNFEKEYTGLYISGHPLKAYQKGIGEIATHSCEDYSNLEHKSEVVMGGMVIASKTIVTRKGDQMAFVTLEDFTGQAELVVFPQAYERYKSLLLEDNIVIVYGEVNHREDDNVSIILRECRQIAADNEGLHIVFDETDPEKLQYVQHIVNEFPGIVPLYIHIKGKCVKADSKSWVSIKPELVNRLSNIVGDNSVSTSWPSVS